MKQKFIETYDVYLTN